MMKGAAKDKQLCEGNERNGGGDRLGQQSTEQKEDARRVHSSIMTTIKKHQQNNKTHPSSEHYYDDISDSEKAVCGVETSGAQRHEILNSDEYTYATPALGVIVLKYEDNAVLTEGSGGHDLEAHRELIPPGDSQDVAADTVIPNVEAPSPPPNVHHAVDDVDAPVDDMQLPIASSVAPPPELLERIRELEDAREHVPQAVPMDMDEERRKLRKRRCIVGGCVVIVAAIVAVVLGVTLEMRESPNPVEPTDSATFTALKDMVESAWPYSGDTLSDPSSPQYKALTWLENNTMLEDYAEWKQLQRYALAVFYYSTNGDDWLVAGSWMSGDDECTWPTSATEPICSNETAFLLLHTMENNLAGTLPSELALLSVSLSKYDKS